MRMADGEWRMGNGRFIVDSIGSKEWNYIYSFSARGDAPFYINLVPKGLFLLTS